MARLVRAIEQCCMRVPLHVQCHWVWAEKGFLKAMGFVDFAGASPVHMLGGVAAIMASVVLGARRGVFVGHSHRPVRSDPKMSVIGVFMMWWVPLPQLPASCLPLPDCLTV